MTVPLSIRFTFYSPQLQILYFTTSKTQKLQSNPKLGSATTVHSLLYRNYQPILCILTNTIMSCI